MYLGMVAVTMDDLRRAADEFEIAQKHFVRIRHARGIQAVLNNLGDICIRLGDIARAAHYFEEASNDQLAMNPSHTCNLALVHRIRGDHPEALRLNADCLAFAERTGAIQLTAMIKTSMSMTYLDLADPKTAEPLLREAHEAAATIGSEVDVYDAVAGLVLVCVRTGRHSEAFTWVASLNELIERGVYSGGGDDWAHAAIAEAHLTSGRVDEAFAIGVSALEQYERAGRRLTAMRVRIVLGRTLAAQGDMDGARPYWQAALDYADEQALSERTRIEALLSHHFA
jgi:tetratricopeptide (TPR) repeat protein